MYGNDEIITLYILENVFIYFDSFFVRTEITQSSTYAAEKNRLTAIR